MWVSCPITQGVLDIFCKIIRSGDLTSNFAITQHQTYDPNLTNNNQSGTINVPKEIDIQVNQNVNGQTNINANVGDTVTYTITAKNNGPDNATGVTIKDLLPAGLSFQSANTYGIGTYNPATGIWTIGNLTSGQTATLTITATVTGTNTIINTAALQKKDQYDWDFNNNEQKTIVNHGSYVPSADVSAWAIILVRVIISGMLIIMWIG